MLNFRTHEDTMLTHLADTRPITLRRGLAVALSAAALAITFVAGPAAAQQGRQQRTVHTHTYTQHHMPQQAAPEKTTTLFGCHLVPGPSPKWGRTASGISVFSGEVEVVKSPPRYECN